jgi:hypothetical protein
MADAIKDPIIKRLDEINSELERYRDLTAEKNRLTNALAALEGKSAPGSTTTGRKRSTSAKATDADEIVRWFADNSGEHSLEEVQGALGAEVTKASLSSLARSDRGRLAKAGENYRLGPTPGL